MVENEALRTRMRMEVQFPPYSVRYGAHAYA